MINIRNYSKSYDKQIVLKNVNLDIPENSILGLMGKNGAGKTSLIKSLVGQTSFEGSIDINNIKHSTFLEKNLKDIHYVQDTPHLYSLLTGLEQIYFSLELKGFSISDYKPQIDELLDLFDLQKEKHKLIEKYSFGMKRKINLIVPLLMRPRILILDEPVLGLDTLAISTFKEYLKKNLIGQSTIIYASHIPELISNTCDSLAIIHNGKIVYYPKNTIHPNFDIETEYLKVIKSN